MPKHSTSDSESEDVSCDNSSSEEQETPANGQNQCVSEYEKQRLSRIAENRAKLEALGLPQMASSLKGQVPKVRSNKGKQKVKDDEDYMPDEGDKASSSLSGDDGSDEDEDFIGEKASGSRKRKVKNKGLKPKARFSGQKHSNSDYIDDDEALRQAIALSLQGSAEGPSCSDKKDTVQAKRKGNIHIQEDKGGIKSKKSFASRLQMTEDELILHFFQFDETGKGSLSLRDLQRIAVAHDFTWTDKELADMICCFDGDGDGKLSLDDFRKIAVRCNMIKGSEGLFKVH
ncbi:hypothetical protein L6164_003642 [Bauhinia variegata]|uniref:Uncharacterized protein n=1 Tax=Bauhinia variegata TaxID=167791 RepID=A0ACB9Q1Y1_BAUVA|nr:hypothetical protein L6164_003642 [Bauhinia variegata]